MKYGMFKLGNTLFNTYEITQGVNVWTGLKHNTGAITFYLNYQNLFLLLEGEKSRLFSSCNEKGNRCKLALQILFISKIFGLTFCNYHEKLRVCEGRCRMQILDLGRLQEF